MFDHETSRRTALKIVGGTSLAALSSRFGHAQAALQPIQMGIQIFTGAVATGVFGLFYLGATTALGLGEARALLRRLRR